MKIAENYNLKELNTFAISSVCKYFVEINSKNDLLIICKEDKFLNNKRLILGGGSNLLLPDFFDGIVVKINNKGIKKEQLGDETIVKVQAGENWHKFIKFTIKNKLYGFENLALIPGNVGSAPIQNIGAYGVEQDFGFYKCEVFDIEKQEFYFLSLEDCKFAYRDSIIKNELKDKVIITEVWYKLSNKAVFNTSYAELKNHFADKEISAKSIFDFVVETRNRKLHNPKNIGNCGSFFKNPIVNNFNLKIILKKYPDLKHYPFDSEHSKVSAAWLIEKAGFKGVRRGDAGVSPIHSLVLVNYGKATSEEILNFSQEIIDSIERKFSIKLEREVNIV